MGNQGEKCHSQKKIKEEGEGIGKRGESEFYKEDLYLLL